MFAPPLLLLVLTITVHALPSSLAVLAQGRSGSTFLSSWFGAHADVTYFIEPCSMIYVEGVVRDLTGPRCARVINQLMKCDFKSVAKTRNQSAYIPARAVGFKGWGHQGGKGDYESCAKRTKVVVKELRVGFAFAGKEVEFEKTIVLLRDPRAVWGSRIRDWPPPAGSDEMEDSAVQPKGWDGKAGFPYMQSLRSMCLEHQALRARAENDESVLLLEYSEVLRDPKKLAERVFEFAQLPLSLQVLEHVEKNINGTCEFLGEPFSNCRKFNATALEDVKWKADLNEALLKQLMDIVECEEIVNKYYEASKVVTKEKPEL